MVIVMKVVTIVGARPQFIKAAPVSRALAQAGHREYVIHTGQHYDTEMSQVFFDELGIPAPSHHLGVGSGSHGWQTGQMLAQIEAVLAEIHPDWVLVFGDTNSTIAGTLAAAKMHIRTGHVEAGLRSFNRSMPEEINRIVADHCADVLFAPTERAMELLANEGLQERSVLAGDVMYDAHLMFARRAQERRLAVELALRPGDFFVATLHRAGTTDDAAKLAAAVEALNRVASEIAPVVMPLHPRTRSAIERHNITVSGIRMLSPLSYLELLSLLQDCRAVLTDSGGLQKEAYFARKLCFTLRDETEWTETVATGANVLCGTDPEIVLRSALETDRPPYSAFDAKFYGDGNASQRIVGGLSKLR